MRGAPPRFVLPLALAFFVIDQASKFLVFAMPLATSPRFFALTRFHNPGLVFSIAAPTWASVGLSLAALFALLWYSVHTKLQRVQWIGLSLLVGGAIGNLVDRLLLGYVRDWLLFGGRSALNLADLFIFGGLFLLFFIDIFPSLTRTRPS